MVFGLWLLCYDRFLLNNGLFFFFFNDNRFFFDFDDRLLFLIRTLTKFAEDFDDFFGGFNGCLFDRLPGREILVCIDDTCGAGKSGGKWRRLRCKTNL